MHTAFHSRRKGKHHDTCQCRRGLCNTARFSAYSSHLHAVGSELESSEATRREMILDEWRQAWNDKWDRFLEAHRPLREKQREFERNRERQSKKQREPERAREKQSKMEQDEGSEEDRQSEMLRLEQVEAALGRATYYQVLDLHPTATNHEIRHACRQLSLSCHPDKFIHYQERATTAFKRVGHPGRYDQSFILRREIADSYGATTATATGAGHFFREHSRAWRVRQLGNRLVSASVWLATV